MAALLLLIFALFWRTEHRNEQQEQARAWQLTHMPPGQTCPVTAARTWRAGISCFLSARDKLKQLKHEAMPPKLDGVKMTRKAGKVARELLLGMKTLPEKNGYWGYFLKKGQEPPEEKPAAVGKIEKVNPAFIEFSPAQLKDERGMWLFYGGWGAVLGVCVLFSSIFDCLINCSGDFYFLINGVIIFSVVASFVGGLALLAYRSARQPLGPPVLLSRSLRRFYWWMDKRQGWQWLDYDKVTPVVKAGTMVTAAGTSTFYNLLLVDMEEGSRNIRKMLLPAPPLPRPHDAEALWEFIRIYMDGSPEQLPAIDPLPSCQDSRADLALMDRRVLGGFVNKHHRLEPGLFNILYTSFWGMVDYWSQRCWLWIQRTAPRPDYPEELREVLGWEGENPYRTRAPTEEEILAWTGKLPHLKRRWWIVATLSTILYGGIFFWMTINAWTGQL